MRPMPKYTATEMRTHAGQFRREVKEGPVRVSFHHCTREHDFDMVCVRKDEYDKLIGAGKK